jgi:hypothetical protein
VRGRLAKGRALLRRRLTRRGVILAAPLAAPAAGIPENLVATTLRAAVGEATDSVATLASTASRGWVLGRPLATAVTLLMLGIAAASLTVGFPTSEQSSPAGGTRFARPPASSGPKAGQSQPAPPRSGPTLVEGRILDLEGRPIGGASIRVKSIQAPPNGKLDAWIDEVKRVGKQPIGLPFVKLPGPALSGQGAAQSVVANLDLKTKPLSTAVTTGPDGRFRIQGLPPDNLVTATITAAGYETSDVYILTRDLSPIRVQDPMIPEAPMIVYYGEKFDHVAAPTRSIVGTVRDQDTGAPIPGVHITGMPLIPRSLVPSPGIEATTDAQGRYQLNGLSTTRGFRLFTESPAGQPYVNGGFAFPAGEAKPGPFTFDIALKRGVLVRARLTDKATGKPLTGYVEYFAFNDNPYLDAFPNFRSDSQITRIYITSSDGRFTIPALPGHGLIAARGPEFEGYLHGVGAEAIKGFDPQLGGFKTRPYYCSSTDKHVLAEINPAPRMKEIALELQADPGRTVKGTIVGPDDQLFHSGVDIHTLDVFQGPQQSSRDNPTFEVRGLPSGPYRLDFLHHGRKLAGSLHLTGKETGDLRVKLEPWGTVTGRVVDAEGQPRGDVTIQGVLTTQPDPDRGFLKDPSTSDRKTTVDAKGRFRIGGLVPGVKYDAQGGSPNWIDGFLFKEVTVGPGEVKDLGDLKLPRTKK